MIDKEIDGTLLLEEVIELDKLQGQMLAYRQEVAPLPLEETRKLYKELLDKKEKEDEQKNEST